MGFLTFDDHFATSMKPFVTRLFLLLCSLTNSGSRQIIRSAVPKIPAM